MQIAKEKYGTYVFAYLPIMKIKRKKMKILLNEQ